MHGLEAGDLATMFLSLGVLLLFARLLGEAARHLGQAPVVGEILAGVLLGPTVLGALAPQLVASLFPAAGPVALLRDGISSLAAALFLLGAGLEVDLPVVLRQGRAALAVSLGGMLVPFVIGFTAAWVVPGWVGYKPVAAPYIFALFLGTALSISALPVIARTLRDLDVFRTDLGMLIIASAVFQDLVGWMVFAIVLGSLGDPGRAFSPGVTILLTLGFVVVMLAFGRRLFDRALPWVHAYSTWPSGMLALLLVTAFLCAAFTEWIGVHAIFGAFIAGVVIGDSRHLRRKTAAVVDDFVSSFFAPLFFAGIGLRVDFVRDFDVALVVFVLVVASAGKILGSTLGARAGGLGKRESWAVGFGMNARGAMEIILGVLALEAHVIGSRLFVALVVMAIVTSVASGPLMQRALRRHSRRLLVDHLAARAFVVLDATHRRTAIEQLARALAESSGIEAGRLVEAAWRREQLMSTALGDGVAAPHARVEGLSSPAVALGVAPGGIDFDALDGKLVQIVVLVATPADDEGAQLELLADIASKLGEPAVRAALVETQNGTEALALLRSGPAAAA